MSSAWLTPPPHKSSRTWWSVSWTSFKLICLSVFMQISAPWEENGTQFCCIQHYVTAWKNQRISFVQTNNIETYSRLNCIMNYEKKNYILNYILQRSYIHNRTISSSVVSISPVKKTNTVRRNMAPIIIIPLISWQFGNNIFF